MGIATTGLELVCGQPIAGKLFYARQGTPVLNPAAAGAAVDAVAGAFWYRIPGVPQTCVYLISPDGPSDKVLTEIVLAEIDRQYGIPLPALLSIAAGRYLYLCDNNASNNKFSKLFFKRMLRDINLFDVFSAVPADSVPRGFDRLIYEDPHAMGPLP